MAEIEPTLESIYEKIRERRVILGHPVVFNIKSDKKTVFPRSTRYLIDGNGCLPYRQN